MTPAELDYVLKNAHRRTDRQLAAALTRLTGKPVAREAVTRARVLAGFHKTQGPGHVVTARPAAAGGLPLAVCGAPPPVVAPAAKKPKRGLR